VGAAQQDPQYSEAGVRIALAPSRGAVAAIAAMASATLALILLTPGAAAARILAATWVACAALHALHAVALHRGRRGVRVLHIDRDGGIELRDGTGAWRAGELRDGSFVAPWLAIVRWRAPGARFDASVVILPDMLPAEDFRRMRVRLRWS
jgi:toxin CptA